MNQELQNLFVFSTVNRCMCRFIHNATGGTMAISANWLVEPSELELQALHVGVITFLKTQGIAVDQIDSIMADSAAAAEKIAKRFIGASDN
jgi:hypothetical protein